jgi:hypothetical protein
MLLRASRTPDDVAGLQELLEQSGAEQELHAVRHRLRDVGEHLLKEARPAMPSDASATPELPRELVQDYILNPASPLLAVPVAARLSAVPAGLLTANGPMSPDDMKALCSSAGLNSRAKMRHYPMGPG